MTNSSETKPPESQPPSAEPAPQKKLPLWQLLASKWRLLVSKWNSLTQANKVALVVGILATMGTIIAAVISYNATMNAQKLAIASAQQQANTSTAIAMTSTAALPVPTATVAITATSPAPLVPTAAAATELPPATKVFQASSDTPCTQADCPIVYQFRQDDTAGWGVTGFDELKRGFKALSTTRMVGAKGAETQVLQLTVDFTGPVGTRASAVEIEVDPVAFPPSGEIGKVSLKDKILTAKVWAPEGSIGDPEKPNGIQLFVKNKDGAVCYNWTPIAAEKKWFRAVWRESDTTFCKGTIDSTQPDKIGIQVSLNPDTVTTYDQPLTFFFDDIGWITQTK